MQQAMENREVGGHGGFDTEHYEGEEERDDPDSMPLGWRFCPTDVEIITNYLRPKVRRQKLPVEGLILEADLYADSPAGLTEKYAGRGHEGCWYFFTPRMRKYEGGTRPDREALNGFWKATGADKLIFDTNNLRIGKKMTLVFYKTRLKQRKKDPGTKTNWRMAEYAIAESMHKPVKASKSRKKSESTASQEKQLLDDYVLCKIYPRRGTAVHRGAGGRNLQVQPLNQSDHPRPEQSLVPSQAEQPEPSSQIICTPALLENLQPQPVQNQVPYPNVSQHEPSKPDPYLAALPESFPDNFFESDPSTSINGIIPDLPPVAGEDAYLWNLQHLQHADQYKSAGYEPSLMLPPLCEPEPSPQAYNKCFPGNPASMMPWDQMSYGIYQQQNNYYGGNTLPHFACNNFPPGPSNYSFHAASQHYMPNFYNSMQYQPDSSVMIYGNRMMQSQGDLNLADTIEGMIGGNIIRYSQDNFNQAATMEGVKF